MRVLVVEDDEEIAGLIARGLTERGMRVDRAATYRDGLLRGLLGTFTVIVLDLMLPGGSGFDLCRRLREEGVTSPILMLTARDGVDDRVRGLESGADDYLPKPFAFTELVARIRALARRAARLNAPAFERADLRVDLQSRAVHRGAEAITLTAKEWDLLEFFVRNEDRVVDRGQITAYVWDENHDPFTNALEVLILRLRRKIDDGYDPKLIHTVRGAGYRFGL